MRGFDSNLPPLEAPTVVFLPEDPEAMPLPLDAAGNLKWERISSNDTVFMTVDTEQHWLEITCEVGGITRRYAGWFYGSININSPTCTQ